MRRALVLCCVILIAACLRLPSDPDAPLDSPFQVKAGKWVSLQGGLLLQFTEVSSDSRCPMDAMCVWAGEAVVAITLSASKDGGRTRRELRTTPAASEITHSGYSIKLVELQPYPRGGVTIAKGDYVATLVVTKN